MKRLLIFALVALCFVACGGGRAKRTLHADQPAVFLPVLPPADLKGEVLTDYMRDHYWDRFNFADTLFLSRVDTTQMLEAYAAYVAYYVHPSNTTPIDSLMQRAAVSRPMFEYFWMLADQILHEPNSPLRNDELYIPVLRAVVASPWFDEWERIAPEHDLQLAMQNRVGQPANDFRYTLASGAQGRLYGVKADYTLVFISNPGCPMCRQLREELMASPRINEMVERGEMKILTLYPDENIEEWRSYSSEMPSVWINAYDKGCVVREECLYDLRAIPALYLLDNDKKVLLKDSVSVPDVERIIDSRS